MPAFPALQLAFSSVSIALRLYLEDMKSRRFRVHHGVIHKAPGAGPNAAGFELREHHSITPAEAS